MFLELFNLIKNNFTTPVLNDLLESNFFKNTIIFINQLLNSFFDMFHDSPSSLNIEYINNELLSEVFSIIILIIFILIIYKIFSLIFNTLKTLVEELKKEISLSAYLEKKGGRKKIKL